jgi:hypothetical protein
MELQIDAILVNNVKLIGLLCIYSEASLRFSGCANFILFKNILFGELNVLMRLS